MRTFSMAAIAVALAATISASTDEAAARGGYSDGRTVACGEDFCPPNRSGKPRAYYPGYASDEVRARALDPGGSYRGYPAWARRALAPKSDGRN